jgi:Flp pilus assembly protein TadG
LIRSIRSARGQSLVEFTVLLPVLLIMISGLIEFGFMLNYYLDVIDASREAARWAAGDDPLRADGTGTWAEPNTNFYGRVCTVANSSIDTGSGGQIDLDPASDDIVVSAFAVRSNGTVSTIPPGRFPPGCRLARSMVMRQPRRRWQSTSAFTTADAGLAHPGRQPAVLVEMWYDYHQILGLP